MEYYIVFESLLGKDKINQISISMKNESYAKDFIETMKAGKYYKDVHPDYELFYSIIEITQKTN